MLSAHHHACQDAEASFNSLIFLYTELSYAFLLNVVNEKIALAWSLSSNIASLVTLGKLSSFFNLFPYH